MPTPTPTEYYDAITKVNTNSDRLNTFVNGTAAETVVTDNGTLPTLAKVVEDFGNTSANAAAADASADAAAASAASADALAADAAQSATYAGGFETPEYASQSAGNAATTAGQIFRVPLGTTPQTFNWYRRLSSGSELVSPLATSAYLASSAGAGAVGADDGASGTLWTTVAGFITKLLSSAGASVIGWIQSGSGTIARTLQDKLRDFGPMATDFVGVDKTGATDSTAGLLAFAAHGGKYKILPPGTYLWDGTALNFGDGFTLIAFGAKLKLNAGTYTQNLFGVCNNGTSLTYNAATPRQSRCRVLGLEVDGNYSNVTLTGYSSSGIHFYQCDDILTWGTYVHDMPGTSGGMPGLGLFYCSDAKVIGHRSENTDRQGISVWETQGASIIAPRIGKSRFREPILVSSNTPPSYQGSDAIISDAFLNNVGTTSGTHVVRFSGKSKGALRSSRLTGQAGLDAVYITNSPDKEVTLEDNDYYDCDYALKVESDGYKIVTSRGNRAHNCTNGIRWNAVGTIFESIGDHYFDCTGQPIYVSFAETVRIDGVYVKGGATNISILNYKVLDFERTTITGMTSASYSVNIGAPSAGATATPNVSDNRLYGNTADIVTCAATRVIAEGNDLSNFIGTAIPVSRVGRDYIWTTTTGTVRVSTSAPTDRATSGTVVGTQT